MIFFEADEHYFHQNILVYQKRPFSSIGEMHEELIKRHNEVVSSNDKVYHIGDFALCNTERANSIVQRLNGVHFFIRGSHDNWLKDAPYMMEINYKEQHIVLCHYAMLRWPKSHYKSFCIVGHSHGKLTSILPDSIEAGLQIDVGVDVWNYYPVSFEQVRKVMDWKEKQIRATGNIPWIERNKQE